MNIIRFNPKIDDIARRQLGEGATSQPAETGFDGRGAGFHRGVHVGHAQAIGVVDVGGDFGAGFHREDLANVG